jgi:hypothetical protein
VGGPVDVTVSGTLRCGVIGSFLVVASKDDPRASDIPTQYCSSSTIVMSSLAKTSVKFLGWRSPAENNTQAEALEKLNEILKPNARPPVEIKGDQTPIDSHLCS